MLENVKNGFEYMQKLQYKICRECSRYIDLESNAYKLFKICMWACDADGRYKMLDETTSVPKSCPFILEHMMV